MKKIIKIICGIFILCTIVENINFIFAQFEDNEGFSVDEIIDSNLENKSDSNPGEEIPEQVTNPDNNQTSSEDNKEEASNSEEITNQVEEDLNITPSQKLRGAPMMTASQSIQTIDTSNYGIIRIKDPNNTGKGITILDRNLGATTTGAGVDESRESFGYYYQWGNNYGFPSDPNEAISSNDYQVDASQYGPNTANGYYKSNIFIKWNNDWSNRRNDDLRGGEGDNQDNHRGYPLSPVSAANRQGPCPENYHIPSIGEWSKLIELWAGGYDNISIEIDDNGLYKFIGNIPAVSVFNQILYLPIAGQRDQNSKISNIGDVELFWSSSPNYSFYSFNLYGNYDDILIQNSSTRANAFPIRCFYDSYRLPVKVTYEVNGGYRTDDESNEDKVITYTKDDDNSDFSGDILLGTVKRKNNCGENEDKKCMFGGWYTLTGDEMWTGNIAEDITLVAKWLEFEDLDVSYSGVNFTIMDRNLGEENSGVEKNAYGYYLTGGEADITCPEGYHIPNTGEWLGIRRLLGSDFNGDLVKSLLDLPFAGKIVDDEVIGSGNYGYYLTKNNDGIIYAKISNSNIEFEDLDAGEKVSVRCFKDYNTGTIKFYTNGGKPIANIITVNRREDGQPLEDAERDNSIFSGWYTTSDFKEGSKLEKNINYKNEEGIDLYAKWECEEGYTQGEDKCNAIYFNITWIDGDGNTLKTDSVKWGETPIYNRDTPTKSSTYDYKYTFNNNWLPTVIAAFEDTGYVAQFDAEYIRKSGGSSSGKNRKNKTETIIDSDKSTDYQTGDIKDSSDKSLEGNDNKVSFGINVKDFERGIQDYSDQLSGKEKFPQEFINAYIFAYQNGITTKSPIYDAKMYSPLTRIQMAKMLSNYAINVLGKTPDITKGVIKFDDVSNKLNKEYGNAVTLAYQLGIMGQNIKKDKFRPYDEVTRAEFATALSRLLYGTEDGRGKIKYYEPHLSKLYSEGIITKINPIMKEKKGYAMIILKRYFDCF